MAKDDANLRSSLPKLRNSSQVGGITLERQAEPRGVYSAAKITGSMTATMADANQRFGYDVVCCPEVVSEDVWRRLKDEIKLLISDESATQIHYILDSLPGINFTVGEDIFDYDAVAAALVSYIRDYMRDATWGCALMLMNGTWNYLKGSTSPMTPRAKGGLRPNESRTAWVPANGFPFIKSIYDYMLYYSRNKKKTNLRGIESVILTLWMRPGRNYVDWFPRRWEVNTANNMFKMKDGLSTVEDADGIPFPIHLVRNHIPSDADGASRDHTDPTKVEGQRMMQFASAGQTAVMNIDKMGYGQVIQAIRTERARWCLEFRRKYGRTMLQSDSDIRRFLDGRIEYFKFSWFDMTMDYEKVLRDTWSLDPFDLDDYFAKCGTYYKSPSPVPSVYGTSSNLPSGNLSGWVSDTGNKFGYTSGVTEWQYRRNSLHYEQIDVILNIRRQLESLGDLRNASEEVLGSLLSQIGHYCALITNDPDELMRIRNTAVTGTNQVVTVNDGTLINRYVDFTPNEAAWRLYGIPRDIGDTQALFNSSIMQGASGMSGMGLGSFDTEKGFRTDPLITVGPIPSLYDARQMHFGFGPTLYDMFSLLSSSLTRFVKTEGTTAKELIDSIALGGNCYIMEDEFNNGIFMPRDVITRIKNQRDPLQCGVFQLCTWEEAVGSTAKAQIDPLAYWTKEGWQSDILDELLAGVINPLNNDAVGERLLDYGVFVGRAFGYRPDLFLRHRSAHPYFWTYKARTGVITGVPQDGVPWPVTPYLSRVQTEPRSAKYEHAIVGVFYEESKKTVQVMQQGNNLDLFTDPIIISQFPWLYGAVTGQRAKVYSDLTAHMDWLPHLYWDPDYPIEEGIHSFIDWVMKRPQSIISGKTCGEIIKESFGVHPIKVTDKSPQYLSLISYKGNSFVKSPNAIMTPDSGGSSGNRDMGGNRRGGKPGKWSTRKGHGRGGAGNSKPRDPQSRATNAGSSSKPEFNSREGHPGIGESKSTKGFALPIRPVGTAGVDKELSAQPPEGSGSVT